QGVRVGPGLHGFEGNGMAAPVPDVPEDRGGDLGLAHAGIGTGHEEAWQRRARGLRTEGHGRALPSTWMRWSRSPARWSADRVIRTRELPSATVGGRMAGTKRSAATRGLGSG